MTIQWMARLAALVSCLLLLLFAVGGIQQASQSPTLTEWVGLAFFPVGVMLGLLLGLKRPTYGGCVAIVSLIAFYSWHVVVSGQLPGGFYFLLFTAPAVLYLASGWLANHRASTAL